MSGKPTRIAFAAAGAVGGSYAALLYFPRDKGDAAGKDVGIGPPAELYLIARGGHLEAMKREGLRVGFPDREVIVYPDGAGDASSLLSWGEMDAIFLTVKSYSTETMLDIIEPMVGPDTLIVSLQNGLGNEDLVAERYGSERTVGGVAIIGAERRGPGRIYCHHIGRLTMGPWGHSTHLSSRLRALAGMLEAVGIPVRLTEDIRGAKWRKLLWNAVWNPLTALTRLTVDAILSDPGGKRLAGEILDEVLRVAEAEGVRIPPDARNRNLRPIGDLYPGFRTSMLQDILEGRPTEHRAILGPILEGGKRHGIPTPRCETLYALLEAREI
ncbi:MAG: 2-dehydropantoate 2-reductase [Thermoplasmata archaeon]|nr:2-dehydropantoate 2-reductase [Thermoplasmata archaeon]